MHRDVMHFLLGISWDMFVTKTMTLAGLKCHHPIWVQWKSQMIIRYKSKISLKSNIQ